MLSNSWIILEYERTKGFVISVSPKLCWLRESVNLIVLKMKSINCGNNKALRSVQQILAVNFLLPFIEIENDTYLQFP